MSSYLRIERGFTQIKRIKNGLKMTSSIDLDHIKNTCIFSYPFFNRYTSGNPRSISFLNTTFYLSNYF